MASPISTDPISGGSLLTLVAGNDYTAAANQILQWTDAAGSWPDLTGAAIAFTVAPTFYTPCTPAAASVAGTVTVPAGSSKQVQVSLSAAYTALLVTGVTAYTFGVTATLTTGDVVALVIGTVNVVASP